MKHVRILVFLLITVLAFGAFGAFASEDGPASSERIDRFTLMEDQTDGDVFSMISGDGDLVIHINDDTPIIFESDTDARERLEEGQTLAELLEGRLLTVTYSITAQSLPPQTSPEKIVIMYETAVHLPGTIEGGDLDPLILIGEVVVNGEMVEAPAPYLNDAGVVMVPLRAIAEGLDFDVNWDAEVRGVRLGVAINLFIGRDEYHVGRMAPITLGTAPELTGGHTFVPMSFFGSVVAGVDAYVFEGQVVIINSEDNDMH